MFPLIGSLMNGVSSIVGGMFSEDMNAKNIAMQRETNQMSIEENQKNRDFQQQMSNTAYQRASADMKSAGLNPAMMFGSGSSASTPSGGVPSLTAPKGDPHAGFANLGEAASKMVASAVQMKTMDKMSDEMSNLEVENTRLRKLTELAGAQTATERNRAEEVKARTANIDQDTTKGKLDRARQEWEAIKYLDLSNIPDAARKAGNIGDWGANAVGSMISSAAGLQRWLPKTRTSERSRSYSGDGKSFDEFWQERAYGR